MSCNSCVKKVQKELLALPGVTGAIVTLDPPRAEVTMSKHIDTDLLNKAVHNSGEYTLTEVSNNGAHMPMNNSAAAEEQAGTLGTYKPLILILFYLLGFVVLREVYKGGFDVMAAMGNFMGGFFIIFSFFKFLNLKGFAEAYSSYDVIAQKWSLYGYIYPFIELILGLAYLFGFLPLITNAATFIIMGVSTIGVLKSVLKKNKIQCACLGTVFNLPMSTVTLVEDLLMVIMALIMIIILI
jgi:copper chaperone CopZ